MYVAVKGGEAAIRNAHALLASRRRGDESVPEIGLDQITGQLSLAVDRVMAEGSLYDRELAALAIKQARGDLIEAIFLARAFRTTLPRFGASVPVDTGAMRVRRRISATFKDLPGGQVLGPTFDYTHRLLDERLATRAGDDASPQTAVPPLPPAGEGWGGGSAPSPKTAPAGDTPAPSLPSPASGRGFSGALGHTSGETAEDRVGNTPEPAPSAQTAAPPLPPAGEGWGGGTASTPDAAPAGDTPAPTLPSPASGRGFHSVQAHISGETAEVRVGNTPEPAASARTALPPLPLAGEGWGGGTASTPDAAPTGDIPAPTLPSPASGRGFQSVQAPMPRVTDLLGDEGLIEPAPEDDGTPPHDLTREPLSFPADRPLRLQALARGDEGFLLALGYSTQRGYARTHPFVGEIRFGEVEVSLYAEELGFAVPLGEISVTECQSVNQFKGSATQPPQFTRGYGLVFGQLERKAMSMALVDRSLRFAELGEEKSAPAQDEEFVLSHCDNVQATGFVEHLKLPHYVDFQAELDLIRRMRAEQADAAKETVPQTEPAPHKEAAE